MKAGILWTLWALSFTLSCSDAASLSGPLSSPGGAGAPAVGGALGTAGAFASAGAATIGGSMSGTTFAGSGGVPVAGAGSLGGGAGASGGGQGGGPADGGSSGMPSEGESLYDANCKLCHAQQGAGSLLGPEIQHPVRDYAMWVVRNGRAQTTFPKAMDKVGSDKLSDAQLGLVFDYLTLPPKPTGGAALFADYCASCHGADAKGGPSMRNIVSEVGKVLELVRNGKSIGQYQMRHDSMPKFSTEILSDAELLLIRDYIDSL
jgi:mono/diheme cytochrome c family protein